MGNKDPFDDLEKTLETSAKAFVDWVQSRYHLVNKTSAVKKAAQLLRVTEMAVWQWLGGSRKTSPSMDLLMNLIMERGTTKNLPR